MSSGGGSTLDKVFDTTMNVVTLGQHEQWKKDLSFNELSGKEDAKQEAKKAEAAAQRQREYELKQLETQKKNKAAVEKAVQSRNARSSVQSQRRQNASLTTDGLGSTASAGGGSKNLLGL